MANSAVVLTNGTDVISPNIPHLGLGSQTYNLWDNADNILYLGARTNGGIYRVIGAAGTSGTDYPTSLPTALANKTIVCYRIGFANVPSGQSLAHGVVILFEVYPTPGRVWINCFNTSWQGWKSVTLT